MSRLPDGERAMASAERQRRYLAKLASTAAAEAVARMPAQAPAGAAGCSGLYRYPDKVAPALRQRLGRRAAVALRDALTQGLEANPAVAAEAEPPEQQDQ